MSKATIVFADGSKEIAHNLDDLRERWFLRRQKEEQYSHTPPELPEERDYRKPANVIESRNWAQELKEDIGRIEVQITNLRAQGGTKANVFYAKLATLQAERQYKIAARKFLKTWAQDQRQIAAIGNDTPQMCYFRLWKFTRSLVAEGRVTLSDDEFALLDAVRAALYLEGHDYR